MEKVYSHKVITTEGNLVAPFENEEQATHDAEGRNKKAEQMGIKTRYSVALNTKQE